MNDDNVMQFWSPCNLTKQVFITGPPPLLCTLTNGPHPALMAVGGDDVRGIFIGDGETGRHLCTCPSVM